MPAHQLPPEAGLIAAAREAIVPRMSQRKAAAIAGISPTRWRQLEAGKIRVRGKDYPESAPAETLARMALAVGVPPAELAAAGRGDAAAVMDALARQAAADPQEEELRAHLAVFMDAAEAEQLVLRYRQRRHGPPRARAG